MEGRAPVYVRVTEFEEVDVLVTNLRKKTHEAREIIAKINELKSEEDRELAAWNASIDEITNRIDQIDKDLTQ